MDRWGCWVCGPAGPRFGNITHSIFHHHKWTCRNRAHHQKQCTALGYLNNVNITYTLCHTQLLWKVSHAPQYVHTTKNNKKRYWSSVKWTFRNKFASKFPNKIRRLTLHTWQNNLGTLLMHYRNSYYRGCTIHRSAHCQNAILLAHVRRKMSAYCLHLTCVLEQYMNHGVSSMRWIVTK